MIETSDPVSSSTVHFLPNTSIVVEHFLPTTGHTALPSLSNCSVPDLPIARNQLALTGPTETSPSDYLRRALAAPGPYSPWRYGLPRGTYNTMEPVFSYLPFGIPPSNLWFSSVQLLTPTPQVLFPLRQLRNCAGALLLYSVPSSCASQST
ncbi:unnamed protein product [Heligmosomoides polygyrus]|uniref:Runt domain-containing protein n=1 Tax=Heligmosomoides polygyrus TaxID=6339 RepID=A0A183FWE4_HELPZ|nr:unnamed protein product [Heligmosomoides polygyrus]